MSGINIVAGGSSVTLISERKWTDPHWNQLQWSPVQRLNHSSFWTTVCKMIHPMLSDHCLTVCPVCDVGVLWPNGQMDQDETGHSLQVGLGPGHIV